MGERVHLDIENKVIEVAGQSKSKVAKRGKKLIDNAIEAAGTAKARKKILKQI